MSAIKQPAVVQPITTIDDSPFLFSYSDPWLKSLSYQLIADLFQGVRRGSPLAYKIGYVFQEKHNTFFGTEPIMPFPAILPKAISEFVTATDGEFAILSDQGRYARIHAALVQLSKDEKAQDEVVARWKAELQRLKAAKQDIPAELMSQVDADKKRRNRSKRDGEHYKKSPSDRERNSGARQFDWLHVNVHFSNESARLASESSPEKRPASFTNIMLLSEKFGFTSTQTKILIMLVCRKQVSELSTFITEVAGSNIEFDNEFSARMLGLTKDQYLNEFRATAPFVRSGMVLIEPGKIPELNKDMYDRLDCPGLSFQEIVEDIAGQPRDAKLERTNYPHVDADVELITSYLRNAQEKKLKGVNILLYGPPGTGKTELAPVIAQQLDKNLRCPGEKSKDGSRALTRGERLASILLALSIDSDDLLCFDEMEDVLPTNASEDGKEQSSGKVFLNRLLEDNQRPVIWIMNHPELLSEAVLRRFTYSVFVPTPPIEVRQQMYATISRKAGGELSVEDCVSLARRFRVSPAYIETAVKFERGVSGAEKPADVTLIEQNLRAAAHRVHGSKFAFDQDPANAAAFNPAFINSDRDIIDIENRIRGIKTPKFSTCLYGPPGTGKSAWARYVIRDILGMEVLFKRYSDLASKWLGETEQKIAAAFQEVEAGNMGLIIDEADSFLRDRSGAEKSWEVTQVNEMLTNMERARGPVFMTTNLMEGMDKAALRRFTFKLNFQYMQPEQAVDCFEAFFGEVPPIGIYDLDKLTPGDFANVASQTAVLGSPGREGLVTLLEQEVAAKGEGGGRIGFAPARPQVSKIVRLAGPEKPR